MLSCSMKRVRVSAEAVGVLPLMLNRSFDFAQDDGVGGLRSQRVCLGLVLGITRPTGTLFREEGIARGGCGVSGRAWGWCWASSALRAPSSEKRA